MKYGLLVSLGAIAVLGCAPAEEPKTAQATPDAWLGETEQERYATVGRHFRGLDVAMAEIGYRYGELHWAGADRNWPYAKYQADKIELTLSLAVERRPQRGPSAAMLGPVLDTLRRAVEAQDSTAFRTSFERLTATCNACHVAEKVAYMRVVVPVARVSPLRAP